MGHGLSGLNADKANACRITVMRSLQAGPHPLILDFRTACTESGRDDDVDGTYSDRIRQKSKVPRKITS